MSDLTILCVTQLAAATYAVPFIAGMRELADQVGAGLRVWVDDPPSGCVERVLDDAVNSCPPGWILRLDDDERASPGMVAWLAAGEYREAEHWAFRRWNLWPDADRHIANSPLWPDLQTRLSVQHLAGARAGVHAGSPFGTGRVAPATVAIEHHKFLVRSRAEREQLVAHYEQLQPGAGERYAVFSVPELVDEDVLVTRRVYR